MGLHPSIRSLLATSAGFTTGNVTFLPERTLALPSRCAHLASPLELSNSSGHTQENLTNPFVWNGFLFAVFVFPPGLVLKLRFTCLPLSLGRCLAWLNRFLSDTCAVHQVARDLGVGADALGLINIKSFRTVRAVGNER